MFFFLRFYENNIELFFNIDFIFCMRMILFIDLYVMNFKGYSNLSFRLLRKSFMNLNYCVNDNNKD